MFPIVAARFLAPTVKRFEIAAPRIARKQQPGQFVIVRLHENGERIPLTIAGSDPERGTISLIVQSIGKTTTLMNLLEPGDAILDVVGPLGKPSDIHPYGTVVVIGGGVGSAIALPTAQAMKKAGNRVISIIGARTRELLILEDEFRAASDLVLVMTDDGSYGDQGFVTDALKKMLVSGYTVDLVLAIGPVPMMKAVSEVTKPAGIPTIVSLNSIMVDGTGMCGGCRVLVSGSSQFACVDGPEFDAHIVDFDVLMQRNAMYRAEEQRALADFNADPERDLALVRGACAMEAMEEAERKAGTRGD